MITARALRSLTICSTQLGMLAPIVLAVACSGGEDPNALNMQYGNQAGSAANTTAGQTSATAGGGGQPGTAGSGSPTAGSDTGTAGVQSSGGMGGSGGTGQTAGGSGGAPPMGGTGGTGTAGTGGGGGGAPPGGVYAARTGSFKMLVYSQNVTGGFHHDSIPAGQDMLKAIGKTQGFEVTVATDESEINAAGLAKYEIVFFMNSTGEIFSADQRKAYEEWMRKAGAYGGVHSATDTASSWSFYKEMTGQYYDMHNPCCANADIQWTTAGASHVVVKGLPSPWQWSEEWYKFNKYADWSTKAGFTILGLITTNDGGTRPASFVREWGNFRSFYTSQGHESKAFTNAQMIKQVSAGIMWAVRREALIK